ncbi:uncharacterized protein LOC143028448 isoform X4 [Oratosquilla oratoria]|uniref:uncharacterized protein LOC143028448 isoform X2 n=1 Tax=Oratosquilla oratoria TaxID=337810 RepID=UPI003F76F0B7
MEHINGKRNEREVLLQFIHTYRDHPALWKVKSKEYTNKLARSKGISALQDLLKELEPDCTRDAVIKKINCLRSSFRRECRKIEKSKKSGASPNEMYTSSLWYFEEMMFVLDQDLPGESCSNLDDIYNYNAEIAEAHGTEGDATPCTRQQIAEAHGTEGDATPYTRQQIAEAHGTEGDATLYTRQQIPEAHGTEGDATPYTRQEVKRRRKSLSKSDHILDIVARKLDESLHKDNSGIDLFGSYVAHRIHSMDIRTAIITRKLINDVLFEAEMGNLNASSRVVAATPEETVPPPIPSVVYSCSSSDSD